MANKYPITPDNRYPYTKYHANRAPVSVNTEAEEIALGPGWQNTPINAEYPRFMYHATHEARIVQNENEMKALGAGWEKLPVEKTDKDITKVDKNTVRYIRATTQVKVNTVEEAQTYVDTLSPSEKTKFFADAEKWHEEERKIDEKLQSANNEPETKQAKSKSAS